MASGSASKSPLENVVPLRSSPRLLAQRRESSNTSPTPITRLFQHTPTQEATPSEVTLIESVNLLSSEERKAKELLRRRAYMKTYRKSKKGPEKANEIKNPASPKKRKSSKADPPNKKKSQPFSASEHARLFHSIFDDSDEAKEHLDLLMTGMSRQQLDANDPKQKNPWMGIVERFNDPLNIYENLIPTDENCGEDIINPANLLVVEDIVVRRDWAKLKDLWNKIRAAITPMLVNYKRR